MFASNLNLRRYNEALLRAERQVPGIAGKLRAGQLCAFAAASAEVQADILSSIYAGDEDVDVQGDVTQGPTHYFPVQLNLTMCSHLVYQCTRTHSSLPPPWPGHSSLKNSTASRPLKLNRPAVLSWVPKLVPRRRLTSVSGLVKTIRYRIPFDQSELSILRIPPTVLPTIRPGRHPWVNRPSMSRR